jgi:membrane fusion protein, multidrug efflux system
MDATMDEMPQPIAVKTSHLPSRVAKPKVIAAALGVLALTGGGVVVAARLDRVATDDAQVEGDIVNISPRIPGRVARLLVKDDQIVEAGQTILELETDQLAAHRDAARADLAAAQAALEAARAQLALTEKNVGAVMDQASGGVTLAESSQSAARAALDQARANVAAARSRRELASLELGRAQQLVAQRAASLEMLDTRKAAADEADANYLQAQAALARQQSQLEASAGDIRAAHGRLSSAKAGPEQVAAARAAVLLDEARVQQAEAALSLAELNVSYATVKAPVRGQVTRRAVEPGQMVGPDRALLSLVPLDDVWVVANFKEDQLADLKPGAPAEVRVDTYGRKKFAARVEAIGSATGARTSLLPPDNASGNFVKVVQRVPVLVRFDGKPDVALRPGMSADVTVRTRR